MRTTDKTSRQAAAVITMAVAMLLTASVAVAEEDEGSERPIKEIRMYADNWSWQPRTIRVEAGTLLRISVDNVDATHRFDLKAYKLKVMLPQDKTTSFEFVADQVGEFRWKCGRTCGNGCAKMTGKLIVTEPGA